MLNNSHCLGCGAVAHGSPQIFDFDAITTNLVGYSQLNKSAVIRFDNKACVLTIEVDNIG